MELDNNGFAAFALYEKRNSNHQENEAKQESIYFTSHAFVLSLQLHLLQGKQSRNLHHPQY